METIIIENGLFWDFLFNKVPLLFLMLLGMSVVLYILFAFATGDKTPPPPPAKMDSYDRGGGANPPQNAPKPPKTDVQYPKTGNEPSQNSP